MQPLIQLLVVVLILAPTGAEALELLAAALAGRPDKIRDLIDSLMPVVVVRVRRVLARNPARVPCLTQDVDEVVQETFLVLFARDSRLLRNYDSDRGMSLANYVGQIAEREAGRVIRARSADKRRGETLTAPDDLKMTRAPDGGEGSEEQLVRQERARALLQRLRDRLTPESFLIFELMYVRLLPAPEVAAMIGCEVQAVYTRKSRIRTTLREVIEEFDGEATQA